MRALALLLLVACGESELDKAVAEKQRVYEQERAAMEAARAKRDAERAKAGSGSGSGSGSAAGSAR